MGLITDEDKTLLKIWFKKGALITIVVTVIMLIPFGGLFLLIEYGFEYEEEKEVEDEEDDSWQNYEPAPDKTIITVRIENYAYYDSTFLVYLDEHMEKKGTVPSGYYYEYELQTNGYKVYLIDVTRMDDMSNQKGTSFPGGSLFFVFQ